MKFSYNFTRNKKKPVNHLLFTDNVTNNDQLDSLYKYHKDIIMSFGFYNWAVMEMKIGRNQNNTGREFTDGESMK